MPEAVFEKLMTLDQPVAAGGRIKSEIHDVNGAGAVSVMLSIVAEDRDVRWTILFGPTQNNAFTPAASGTFENNNLATHVPVFGPKMFVMIENLGPRSTT